MMSKNILIGFLGLCLVIITTLLFVVVEDESIPVTSEVPVQSNVAGTVDETTSQSNLSGVGPSDEIENRVSGIESRISSLSGQVEQLSSLIKESVNNQNERFEEEGNDQSESESTTVDSASESSEESGPDPLSPAGIELSNELQNRYVTQIDNLFQGQQFDDEWATSMESEMLPALSNLDVFASKQPSTIQSVNIPQNNLPDVSVSQFNCRSQLCDMEVIAGTVDEMIAYQGFMVEQTKTTLPSIIFSTIEPYGNKFRMRAFLGDDEFEFPAPSE